jgi:hypothetical protein
MNDEVLNLLITRENAEYLIRVVSCGLFGCYQGDKNADDLVEHPENIEQNDFDDIALPQTEVKKAQAIITDLQKLLYRDRFARGCFDSE